MKAASRVYRDAAKTNHSPTKGKAADPMTTLTPQVRKDGKKPRSSRGVPTSWHNGLTQPTGQDWQNWHELVSAGPKGDVAKRVARAEAHAASRTRTAAVIPLVDVQQAWHFDHTPNRKPGRLVLHRTGTTARSGGGIDRAAARARRGEERKAAAA